MSTSTLRLAAVIAAAVAVTAVAAAAVTAAVTGGDETLSSNDVDRLLAGQTLSPDPTTGGTPDPSAAGPGTQVHALTPGTVTVRCDGDLASLLAWSPNPGWRSDDPVRGPASMVSVRFESDTYPDYKVTATCTDGTAAVVLGPDDHHGGDDRGGDGDPYDDHGGNRGPGGGD